MKNVFWRLQGRNVNVRVIEKCHFFHVFCAETNWKNELIRTGNHISSAIPAAYNYLCAGNKELGF